MSRPVVLDASVGVKWLVDEPGSEAALALRARHGDGSIHLIVPVIFLHEVLDVARRFYGVPRAREVARRLALDGITVVGLDAALTDATLDMCDRLGCSFYDAAAPAVAELLGAELVSADRRAHASAPGVSLIG